jgi:diguanylate cyclase (GGDEF)-like protein
VLENLNITKKFPFVMISFALLSALVTGIIAYTNTYEELKVAAQDKLFSLLESRKATLHHYFDDISNDVIFHAQNPVVREALTAFSLAWADLGQAPTKQLQKTYVDKNPYADGQKSAFLYANNGTRYDQAHAKYHPTFLNLKTLNHYHDFFLFDTQGNLLYTVVKERDFATNILTGEWAYTHLASAFNKIIKTKQPGQVIFEDFQLYPPSNNEPAGFIGTKVTNRDAKVIGVLILQMPISPLNNVMQVTAGMGKSGETYVVGPDKLMRSDSRFFAGESILKTRVNTPSVDRALAGHSGVHIITDYRGVSVYSAYAPFNFAQLRWMIAAEVDEHEIMQPIYNMNYFFFISTCIVVGVILLFGYLLSANIAQPIVNMTHIMRQLADNNLTVNIGVPERKDEVGYMAKALNIFKKNAIERDKLQKQLVYLANHDPLTGLPSRQYGTQHLSKKISQCAEHGNKLALLFIDLDGFKTVNDSLGHTEGDALLIKAAQKLQESIRADDLVARIGGDEFVVVLAPINKDNDYLDITQRILNKIDFSYSSHDSSAHVTASIGIAIYPDDATSAQDLIRVADSAMYQAKNAGKNKAQRSSKTDENA